MEILSFFVVLIVGCLFGIFTGLTPGIHVNLIATIIFVNIYFFREFLDLHEIAVFIISMSVVHTFVDFIASIIFGVPNEDTALSVLPAHHMVLNGEGYKAILYSAFGSFFSYFLVCILLPIYAIFVLFVYDRIKEYIVFLLIFVSVGFIFLEKGKNLKFWAFLIVVFSGSFGMFILNSPFVFEPLLIIFTGLFGCSSIIYSLKDNVKIPKQKFDFKIDIDLNFLKSIFGGVLAASICSISPGIGNAQAGTLSSFFDKNSSRKIFIAILSAINTANFVFSLVTFFLITKARNGAILVVMQLLENINNREFLFLLFTIFLCSCFGLIMTIYLGKKILKVISKINLYFINFVILFSLFFIVFFVSGFVGIIGLLCATSLGLLAISLGVRRVHLMNVLLIPIILNLI